MLTKALNHMAVPQLAWEDFLSLAAGLGCVGVEFRNDLNRPLFEGTLPETVAERARAMNLRVLALAELKMFNAFTDATRAQAEELCAVARACGAETISLIPRNDGLGRGNGERQANLRLAMRELLPVLRDAGLRAMIEPLGFESSSLRAKSEVVDAIEALGARDTYALIHDTFHHHLAGGGPVFADYTGLVHISGVKDPTVSVMDMVDGHRVLVDRADRLGTMAQLEQLQEAGYRGAISFEPFAPEIHALRDPKQALAQSFEFITGRLEKEAA